MGLRAWFKRLYARQGGTSTEATTFPVEVFWRSVCNLKQPVLLVKGDGLQVLAATEEAHELFDSRNTKEISGLLRSGLDPHTLSRIQIAVANPVALVSDLPMRMQNPDVYVNVSVTVSPLPEYPEKNAALLFLKDNRNQSAVMGGTRMMTELLSRLPLPAWVVDTAGRVVFSNAAFPKFPLEVLKVEPSSEGSDSGELTELMHLQNELAMFPARVRNTMALADHVYDLGPFGPWRVLHFPFSSQVGEGSVGVVAMPLESRATRLDDASDDARLRGVVGQETLTHVLQIKEAERTALAREIHDSLGQELTVLKLELRRLYTMVIGTSTASTQVLEHFQSVRELVDKLAKTARRIAFEMRQDLVNVKGLAHSVQELVLDLRNRLGLQIQLEITPGWVEPEQGMAHHMHRSLQEMLNNVSKHAKANRCLVKMGRDETAYWLEVRDDGVGMPAVRKTRSIGLRSLTERAELYGGKVVIQTRPAVDGTLVRMELRERRKSPPPSTIGGDWH
ncbi:histidine kinase [Burkholderia ubonensis]|uniref:sensor histidine kinase n=1 Tax=Burkholderia ubonensis TaxID=101571 RepID=UPI0007543C85|nr:histidine kinase [Burkholderia ubonensis]